MNTKNSASDNGYLFQFDPAVSLRNSRLHEASRDEPDHWTALLSAFLIVCMLAALTICSWQVGAWENAKSLGAQPAVATEGTPAHGQNVF